MIQTTIKKGLYYDSVKLMLVTNKVAEVDGVSSVAVVMGTDLNKDTLKRNGLLTDEAACASKTDLIIGLKADSEATIQKALEVMDGELNKSVASDGDTALKPLSIETAVKNYPASNFCIISVPGEYAAAEVQNALKEGLNVMLFSDNVSVQDEIRLKEMAVKKDLLLMGPDCGTAHINGVPICFSNVVTPGNIGIVAASGTGCQEVMTLIDKFGGGLSQVIGTGGRDLSKDVKGIMTKYALKLLQDDDKTRVITLISKPPAPEIVEDILEYINKNISKPLIINFIGGSGVSSDKIKFSCSLKEAAIAAVKASGITYEDKPETVPEVRNFYPENVIGLYTGGTLAYEAYYELKSVIPGLKSNLKDNLLEEEIEALADDLVLDLGDDRFTQGRAHPMIDPSFRNELFKMALAQKKSTLILLDFVLGYGSNKEPQSTVIKLLNQAAEKAETLVLACICGTYKDPQDYNKVKKELEEAGVIVFESNIDMLTQAKRLLKK